jgi:hypothetical protein
MHEEQCPYCNAFLPAHRLGCATQRNGPVNIMQTTLPEKPQDEAKSALDRQVGGSHYKGCKIQPITFIHANNLGFMEGSVVKYITRWRAKGGVEDLKKCIHYLELLIEHESKK